LFERFIDRGETPVEADLKHPATRCRRLRNTTGLGGSGRQRLLAKDGLAGTYRRERQGGVLTVWRGGIDGVDGGVPFFGGGVSGGSDGLRQIFAPLLDGIVDRGHFNALVTPQHRSMQRSHIARADDADSDHVNAWFLVTGFWLLVTGSRFLVPAAEPLSVRSGSA